MKNETFLNKQIHNINYGQKELQNKEIYIREVIYIQQTSSSYRRFYICSFICPNSYLGVEMFSKQELREFDNYLLLSKGLQKITREGHLTSINIILKKIQSSCPSNSEFQEHIIWMHNQEYSHSHITNTSKAIEYFTEFQGNPLRIAKTRRPKTLITDVLTEAEVNAMIRNTKDIREKAMISLLAFSGIRNKEFCNLKVEDVDFGGNQIIVKNGKYSRDRRANIGSICTNILIEYIMENRKQKGEYLFTTIYKNNQYQTNDLRKFIRTLAERTRIEKRVYPHLFRHALATNLLKRGASIILIQEQLGHSDITTTCHYIQALPYKIKSEYEHYLPAYA